jgi:hypothetical protein
LPPDRLGVRSGRNDLLAHDGDILTSEARKVGSYEEIELFAGNVLAQPFGHPSFSFGKER